MDSPEPSKNNDKGSSAATINTSESPQVQESPFLKFISNLSPIQPVKSCHVTQGFVGLNSPPIVFMSPRISCHRETKYLERPQCTQSPGVEISQSDNGDKSIVIEPPYDSEKLRSQLSLPGEFITDTTLKAADVKNDENTRHCSPPPSVDEYLADPVDTDPIYSANNPDVKQSDDTVASSSQSKEITLKYDDSKDGHGDKAEEPLRLSQESNKFHQEKPVNVEEPEKLEEEKNDVERASQEHTNLESNLSADVLETQHSHDSLAQCAGSELRDNTPELMPEPMQDAKECEDCDEMVSTSHLSTENIPRGGSEATLKYHGIRRRCLQFGEAFSNSLGSNNSHMNINAISSQTKMVKLSGPVTSLSTQRCSGTGNFQVTGCKPSGIGLHLNSIINAMPPGCTTTTAMRLSDGLQGMKSTSSISVHNMENMKRCLISSNVDGQSSVDTGNEGHEIDASIAADSFISESSSLAEHIASYPASAHDKRKLSPTDAGNSEEFPSKKKKKTTTDENGCKRCNCKKSKCLKLYCDCFAAGIYCSEPCSCQGCLNREGNEDTVLEARRQIESRNPLAFLPKVVQNTADVPLNNMEDANLTTPSSARHKRGCNCKRSMCLKKYCECYQANVGCSSGCRCEGCKNAYGRKEDYVTIERALSRERLSSKTDLLQIELHDPHHLSPITPSLQCSDQGKEAAKSRLSEKYLPSPESDVNMMLEASSYECQKDCKNMDDQLSQTRDSVANVLQLTPLSYPESTPSASSFSSKAKEWTDIPQSRLSHGTIHQLSVGSLRWRSSPNTPRTGLGETQYVPSLESDNKLFDILEDETPDILKEVLTPLPNKSVKANSPNQKRVSPPHSHLRRHGLSSSGSLKSGRKFILQSVPSFPPLTPCTDSKGKGREDLDNSSRK
ncbi:hypothetical protein RIF29_27168 [Crotalaria pallida]|uniref:CRC domain-containing protein n=1 Tax=Crotalaria pallida TaxID=3830 RepID=A0AAN9EPJ9_CROPI